MTQSNFQLISFPSPAFMAPMAGFTDRAFRQVVKEFGAGLLFAEFISADGLVRKNKKTMDMLKFDDNERPFGIQLFGSDPFILADAAQIVAEHQPDIIDLNFGCPVTKVVKRGAGAFLLNDLPRMQEIARQVVQAVSIPVAAKIRSGWDKDHIVAEDAADRLAQAGVQAITVHPRTRSMGYRGKADWQIIAKVKQKIDIPIIGNGDIWQAEDAIQMMQTTNCNYVMVARGALGNPWIFQQINDQVNGTQSLYQPSPKDWLRTVKKHFRLAAYYDDRGEEHTVKEMRKHIAYYLKGKSGAAKIRSRVNKINKIAELEKLLTDFVA